MNEIIQVRNLKKIYKDKIAVNGLFFNIERGQIFGFLGTNGAGKSTTIKMLTGQLEPTEGDISICGINPTIHQKKLAYEIGLVPENMCLYNDLTVKENLLIFAKLYGISNNVVSENIERLELKEYQNFKVKKLSKGYKQRLLLARSIQHNPDIIFMDEPTSGLDALMAKEIRKIILELKADGKTIFLTTHYMNEAEELCDYVSIIKEGTIIEEGNPYKLKLKYGNKHIKTQAFGKEKIFSFYDIKGISEELNKGIETIHSGESNLEEVFIKVTKGK